MNAYNGFESTKSKTPLDLLLEQADCKIEDLLKEENIVTEIRFGNPKVMNYLNTDSIGKLVKYVTEMPPDPLDTIRTYTLPYVSNEILSIDSPEISNSFFKMHIQSIDSTSSKDHTFIPEDYQDKSNDQLPKSIIPISTENTKEEQLPVNLNFFEGIPLVEEEILYHEPQEMDLLELLFKFVKTDIEINSLLSGYFSNAIQALMNRNRNALLNYVFKNDLDKLLIYHSYDRSMSDLIIKLLTKEGKSENFNNTNLNGKDEFYEQKAKIIECLMGNLKNSDVREIIHSNSYIISSIISSKLFMDYFNTHFVIDFFYQIILTRHHPTAQLEGLNVLLTLLKTFFGPTNCNILSFDTNSSNQKSIPTVSLYAFITETPKFLVDIFNMIEIREEPLIDNSKKNKFASPNYCYPIKIKIIEFLYYLMYLFPNESISILYCNSKLSLKLLRYFVEYLNHSIIHNLIYKVFEKALEINIPSIIQAFSIECDLATFIINNFPKIQNQFENSKKQFFNSSYIYLFYLANKLNNSTNDIIKDYLTNLKEWQEFVINTLKFFNYRIETSFGKKSQEPIQSTPIDEKDSNENNNMQFGSLDEFLSKIPEREDDLDQNEPIEMANTNKKKDIFNQRINEKILNFDDIADFRNQIFNSNQIVIESESEIKKEEKVEIDEEDEYYKNVNMKSLSQIEFVKETNLDPIVIESRNINHDDSEINYWNKIPKKENIEDLLHDYCQ